MIGKGASTHNQEGILLYCVEGDYLEGRYGPVFSGGSGNSGEQAHDCRRGLRWSGMLRKAHTLSLELWGMLWRWWNLGGCSTVMWFAGDGFSIHDTGIENARWVWKL